MIKIQKNKVHEKLKFRWFSSRFAISELFFLLVSGPQTRVFKKFFSRLLNVGQKIKTNLFHSCNFTKMADYLLVNPVFWNLLSLHCYWFDDNLKVNNPTRQWSSMKASERLIATKLNIQFIFSFVAINLFPIPKKKSPILFASESQKKSTNLQNFSTMKQNLECSSWGCGRNQALLNL